MDPVAVAADVDKMTGTHHYDLSTDAKIMYGLERLVVKYDKEETQGPIMWLGPHTWKGEALLYGDLAGQGMGFQDQSTAMSIVRWVCNQQASWENMYDGRSVQAS